MVTVLLADDQLPAHVHVFGDGEAKINLVGEGPPNLVWADDVTRAEVRRSMRVVAAGQAFLVQRWGGHPWPN